ncbi:MAG TPA: hypothetical protein VG944_22895 [Fimbriimonas sp.]|nr:hypothetical protein [Fimbriimonas sp.]
MAKALFLLAVLVLTATLAGCGTGDISYDQQQAKKDALDKVAKKVEGPNFVQRPQ